MKQFSRAPFLMAALIATFVLVVPAWTQDKPANNLEIIHEKLKADKKLIVAKYMELTESEAKSFWPVYEDYQQDLQKINERLLNLLQSYAAEYRNKSLTDEKAKKLLDEWIALEQDMAAKHEGVSESDIEDCETRLCFLKPGPEILDKRRTRTAA
jgi:hypothetical protein